MTKATVEVLERWTETPSSSEDRGLGALFRAVAEPQALSPAALAQVHARLGSVRYSSSLRRRVREIVLAGVMLLAGSSLAVAGWGASAWWSARTGRRLAGNESVHPTVAQKLSKSVILARKSAVPAGASAQLSEPPAAVAAFPPVIAKGADRVSPAPTDSSELAAESLALQAALVKLRREHDAQGALALLDQSEPLFAHGALALEAQVARLDALLLLGRQSEALAILEHLPLAHMGRGGELRLQRAELHAKDDCALALGDFDALVQQALSPQLAERALYGRAVCEMRVADDSHAQHDFDTYLSRFPEGRFAAQARSALARLSGKAR